MRTRSISVLTRGFAVSMGLAIALIGGAARPAAGQGAGPLPCDVTYDRTVTPGQVNVDDKVHVKITIAGGAGGACAGSSRPADVFFVVDNSITMFENLELIRETRLALSAFVNQMDFRTSKAGLITYAAEDSVKVNLSADRDRLLQSIQAMRKEQENDVRGLSSAIRTATQKLDNDGTPGTEKMVIIVVAGPDVNGTLVNLPTVTQAAKNAGVKFAFMLWYDATGRGQWESRYTHYVEASSVCADTDMQCTAWGGIVGRRWSWPVCDAAVPACPAEGSMAARMRALIERLLRAVKITRVDVAETMHSGSVFLDTTASPPPTGGTVRDPRWSFTAIPAGGITIDYDARMIFADETYPVTGLSLLNVVYSDGSPGQRDLPNPDIVVVSGPTPTPSATSTRRVTATRTPTAPPESPTPTDSPVTPETATATATRPPASATATQVVEGGKIYLPAAMKVAEMGATSGARDDVDGGDVNRAAAPARRMNSRATPLETRQGGLGESRARTGGDRLAVPGALPVSDGAFVPDPVPNAGGGDRPAARTGQPDAPAARPWLPALPGLGVSGLDSPLAVTRIESDRDTFTSFRNRGSNYGRESRLYVGEHPSYGATRALLWWDVLGELPRNQAVRDATMELYLREAGPSGDAERDLVARRVTLDRESNRRCKESWDERGPTWDDFPDYDDDRIDRTGVGTVRDTYDWDVTEVVQRWRLAEWWPSQWCNGGIYLQGYETGNSFRGFDSSEGSNPPDLVIDHVTDTKPPVATMKALPPFITRPDADNPARATIRLEWAGDDPEPFTGIDYFQAFVRTNGGNFQVLGDRLQTFGGSFFGTNGHFYEFNVYPFDQAGNVQPGKAPDASTLVDWSAPVTTMNPLAEWQRGPFEISWAAQDLPNDPGLLNSGLDSYEVHYNIGGTSWGLLGTGIRETRVLFNRQSQCALFQFRVAGRDKAGNVELMGNFEAQTTVDGVAPAVAMRSTLPIGRRDFTVSWQGQDDCAYGISGYDVQMKRGTGGPWTDWVTNGQETSKVFTGEMGESYRFRARARDKAGNQSAYPDAPQVTVVVVDPATLTHKVQLPVVSQR